MTTSKQQTVIITGASSGIGEATARLLVERGDRVLMVGRNAERLEAARERMGASGTATLAIDVTADDAAGSVVANALERFGRIDALVNNAGVSRQGEFATLPMSDVDEMFAVNVRAPYALTRAVVPHLAPGSSVVFVGSNLTRVGKPGAGAYSASKSAVEALSRSLAVELGEAGIRVNAVSPGVTRTEMTSGAFDDQERHRQLVAMSPVGFLGEPVDVAQTIAFLTSEGARYINGAAIVIDGGRILK